MKLLTLWLMLFSVNSYASVCDGVDVAKALDGLLDVRRLYNCRLEVVRIETQKEEVDGSVTSMLSYLVYGKDEFRCKTTNRICPKANFELSVPKECLLTQTQNKTDIKYANGYNIDGTKLRNHINIKKSEKQIQFISFGQTELESAKRINYVQCQLEIFGDNDEN